jgi:hypothetical protein
MPEVPPAAPKSITWSLRMHRSHFSPTAAALTVALALSVVACAGTVPAPEASPTAVLTTSAPTSAAATSAATSAPPTAAPPTSAPPTSTPTEEARPTPQTLGRESDRSLEAGTYRVAIASLPAFLVTVPDGWVGGASLIHKPRSGHDVSPVALMFWDVDQVYGHPCQWRGTLFRPGPTVDDLAEALVDIPLRNATQPVDVTLDGYAGKYLEWSVPADIETEPHGEYVSFDDCDQTGDGDRAFESWTGKAGGSDRYQQGPGQVDRLWILDVDGIRLVIDAFEMPYATAAERAELMAVVESIRFER